MHYAVSESKFERIENMEDARGEISFGELFNAVDKEGNSPLYFAKLAETVNIILQLDTDGEILPRSKGRMLRNAAREGNIDMVKVLVTHGFTRAESDEDGTTAFTCALGTLNNGDP